SVSGGCIEGDVIVEADGVMTSEQAVMLEYGVSNSDAWKVGLACGGRIRVLLQPVDAVLQGLLVRLQEARAKKCPTVLASCTDSGESALYSAGEALMLGGSDLSSEAEAALAADRPRLIEAAEAQVFLNVFNPPLRLYIIGAVHITQALAPMARLAGFEVTVIDPRGAFLSTARLSGIRGIEDWPDVVLEAEGLDRRAAVITLTHDPKLDDAALSVALKSEAFYIGCLGSKKTHAARLGRLGGLGFDAEALGRIHGPVGLKIGARSPSEIAISAIAQMIGELHS
ncbi:MAG: XdhC/CoxI family protein, partial [Sphingomonadales bacterium]